MTLPAPAADRTCLVTGASSGIGAEMARELAKRGHGVTLVARRESALQDLAAEMTKAHKVRVEVLPCDLSDADARAALAERVADLGLTVAREATPRLEEMSIEEVEAFLIKKTLARCDGNARRAAEDLGLSRSAFYRRLEKYGL